MRAGIIQSGYIPWRGYFDFIGSVDVFVLFDDVLYPRGRDWRNRNQVKTREGLRWLTIPIQHSDQRRNIDQVSMAETAKPWRESHRGLLRAALGSAPWFGDAMALWEEGVTECGPLLSPMNEKLLRLICRYLGIGTPIVRASDYPVEGAKTERLIALLGRLGADTYLSGPSAEDYIDPEQFRARNIRLEYKTYDYAPYPQLWGEFVVAVSVLDLIANTGPDASKHLRSRQPNRLVVP